MLRSFVNRVLHIQYAVFILLLLVGTGCEAPVTPAEKQTLDDPTEYFWDNARTNALFTEVRGSLEKRVTLAFNTAGAFLNVSDAPGSSVGSFRISSDGVSAEQLGSSTLLALPSDSYFSSDDTVSSALTRHARFTAVTRSQLSQGAFIFGSDTGGLTLFTLPPTLTRLLGGEDFTDIASLTTDQNGTVYGVTRTGLVFTSTSFGTPPWTRVDRITLAPGESIVGIAELKGEVFVATSKRLRRMEINKVWSDETSRLGLSAGTTLTAICAIPGKPGTATLHLGTTAGLLTRTPSNTFKGTPIPGGVVAISGEMDGANVMVFTSDFRAFTPQGVDLQLSVPAFTGVVTAAGITPTHSTLVGTSTGELFEIKKNGGPLTAVALPPLVTGSVIQFATSEAPAQEFAIITSTEAAVLDFSQRPPQATMLPGASYPIHHESGLTLLKSNITEGDTWRAGTLMIDKLGVQTSTGYGATLLQHFDRVSVPLITKILPFEDVFSVHYAPLNGSTALPQWTIHYAKNIGPVAIEQVENGVRTRLLVYNP